MLRYHGGQALATLALAAAAGLFLLFTWASLSPPPIPAEALQYFRLPEILRGRAYTRALYLAFAARTLFSFLFLCAAGRFLVRHLPGPAFTAQRGGRLALLAALVALALQGGLALLLLPLDWWSTFVHPHVYGLSTRSAALWWSDRAKSVLLDGLITAGLLAALYWSIYRWPRRWWLPAGVGFSLFLLLSSALGPVLIDPLFHNFRPLQEQALAAEVRALAARAGVPVDQVLVMDASRRTRAVNAYFTGVGGTRRIVLYDNLVRSFSDREVLLVLAHELGHWRLGHIHRGMATGAAGGFLAFLLLSRWLLAASRSWGSRPADPRGLPFLLAGILVLSFLTLPVQNGISRAYEAEADAFARQLTGDPDGQAMLEARLARRNLADVAPNPWLERIYFTHPSPLRRIQAAEAASRRLRRARAPAPYAFDSIRPHP